MAHKSIVRPVIGGSACVLIAACASMPWADDDERYSDEIAQVEQAYVDAEDQVERGRDLISEGRDKIVRNERRREREHRAAEDKRLKANALRRQLASAASGTVGTGRIEQMAKRLRRIQKDINEHEEEIADAADDIADARASIERGQTLVAQGQEAMRTAERRYELQTGRDLSDDMG